MEKNKFGFEAPLDSWENKLYNSATFKQAIDSSKIIKKLINKTNIDSLNNRINGDYIILQNGKKFSRLILFNFNINTSS